MNPLFIMLKLSAAMLDIDQVIERMEEAIADHKSAVLDDEKKQAKQNLMFAAVLMTFKVMAKEGATLADTMKDIEEVSAMSNLFDSIKNPAKQ